MTMQHDFDRPIDILAVEREARRLRAEAFAQAMSNLRDRFLRRERASDVRTA